MKPAAITKFLGLLGYLETAAAHTVHIINHQEFDLEAVELLDRQTVSLSVDCNKLLDQVVGFISKYPDYSAKVLGVTAGTSLAYNVCRSFNGQNCRNVAGSVGSGLTLVVWYGKMVQNPASEGAQGVKPDSKRGDEAHHVWLREELERHLVQRGLNFDSIAVSRRLSARDEDESHNLVLEVRGVQEAKGGAVTDHRLVVREDGAGFVQISPYIALGADEHARREQNGWFNIHWEVVDSGNGLPDHDGYTYTCDTVANDWASRAESKDMGDYIGLLNLGGAGSIQFRVAPQDEGGVEASEDVNKCYE